MNLFKLRFDRRHDGASRRRGILNSHVEHMSVVRWHPQQAVLRLTGVRLKGWTRACDCGKQMLSLLDEPSVRELRIDLEEIDSISSEALSQFVLVHCRASQLGKQIVLFNLKDNVREVFHVTRLDRLLGIVDEDKRTDESGWSRDFEKQLLV
jgi:anti-sigma B factor antagonist